MKKKEPRRDYVTRIQETTEAARKRLGTPVDERWFIEEYRPAYTSSGYDGQDNPEKVVGRSPYFYGPEGEKKVNAYREGVNPDDGHELRIRHQICYERLERTWV